MSRIIHHLGREKVYWVSITSTSRENMLRLAGDYRIDIFAHTAEMEDDRFRVDGFASASQVRRLRDDDYQVEILGDLDEIASEMGDWFSDEDGEPTV